jgi:hypothetical protein
MKNIRRTLGRTGCLAPRAEAMRRRYAERILKGQYPAALPGQASTKYEPGYRKPPRTAKTHVSAERCYREGVSPGRARRQSSKRRFFLGARERPKRMRHLINDNRARLSSMLPPKDVEKLVALLKQAIRPCELRNLLAPRPLVGTRSEHRNHLGVARAG